MSKRVNIDVFSVQSINDAIKEIELYKQDIIRKCGILAERLAHEGVVVSKMQIMAFPAIDTGELLESITMKPGEVIFNGKKFYVYTDCPYAGFVEFGTGIVGESNPHPNPMPVNGYSKYDQNGHGDLGWFYPGDDGKWHWTKGMPSRPFMYNTVNDLVYKVVAIAKEVFGG
jgi:hypothetical protein